MVGPRNVGCQEAGFLPALLKPSVLQIHYSSFKYAIILKNTFYHTEDRLLQIGGYLTRNSTRHLNKFELLPLPAHHPVPGASSVFS